jgi:hypothetical protein
MRQYHYASQAVSLETALSNSHVSVRRVANSMFYLVALLRLTHYYVLSTLQKHMTALFEVCQQCCIISPELELTTSDADRARRH